jgi:hypothetical protein
VENSSSNWPNLPGARQKIAAVALTAFAKRQAAKINEKTSLPMTLFIPASNKLAPSN